METNDRFSPVDETEKFIGKGLLLAGTVAAADAGDSGNQGALGGVAVQCIPDVVAVGDIVIRSIRHACK